MVYVWLIIGFALLIKGADYFVSGASSIAKLLSVSPLLIGLTIVAFGTSSPEAIVSIIAALNDTGDIAIGNVVGSNIFNISLVVGLTAVIAPLKVNSEMTKKQIPFTLLASVIMLILISDRLFQFGSNDMISRLDSLILLLLFVFFLSYLIWDGRKDRSNPPKVKGDAKEISAVKEGWGKAIFITIGGLIAIIFGGNIVVENSTEIAYSLGMSETLVGLTIVAVGTSLPELVTSITAAFKKESDIALGNIVGSNIFNILFILGITSMITPLSVDPKIIIDVIFMIILTVVLLIFSRSNYRIGKIEGSLLIVSYIIYLAYIIFRN